MSARSIWKGSIRFGLVQIPVALYPAERPDHLSFQLLDRGNMAPIQLQRVNAVTRELVDSKNVVRGFKTKDGTYVIVTDDDLRRANVESTQAVDILDFIDESEIDPIYFDKPYYVAPIALRKGGPTESKAYALLRETLQRTEKVAVAKVVLRTREHLGALRPSGDVLVFCLLRFAHELRDTEELNIPRGELRRAEISPSELQMAEHLVREMSASWDPSKYRDTYRDDLMALLRRKAREGEAHPIDDAERAAPEPRKTDATEMFSLLEQSVRLTGKDRAITRAANTNAPKRPLASRRKASKSGRAA